jgi:hypothetical protein
VFIDPSWDNYANHIVSIASSGYLEVDDFNRRNWVFFAGSTTGMTYRNDTFVSTSNGVALALSHDVHKFHAFPANFEADPIACARCGRFIPYARME